MLNYICFILMAKKKKVDQIQQKILLHKTHQTLENYK
jgi:hypothetical protein